MSDKPKIAYFSPLNPDPSGVADYSEELLPHLARHVDVDLFVDDRRPAAEVLSRYRVIDVAGTDPLPLLPGYDAVLYQIGNSSSHGYAYETLLQHPGLVVLHDVCLAHLVLSVTHDRGRSDLLLREMRAQHGDRAAERARRWRYLGTAAPWDEEPLRYTLNRRVLENAVGVLVHSRFAESEVRRTHPGLWLKRLDHHAHRPDRVDSVHPADPTSSDRAPARESGGVVFVTAGYLTPTKRIDVVLRALARLRSRLDFHYRLVGRIHDESGVRATIRGLGLDRRVTIHGEVGKAELYRHLQDADICVNLRHPNHGETSGIVMRALACGRPVVVSASGWFLELPDGCARKVQAAGGDELDILTEELALLAGDPALRAGMGERAREYASRRDLASRAEGYVDFLARGLQPAAGSYVSADVSRQLEGIGILESDGILQAARRDIRDIYGESDGAGDPSH